MNEMNEDVQNGEFIKIMTLGNMKVGKTNFIFKYTENKFHENHISTNGLDYKIKKMQINNKNYQLLLFDTAGQERYKSIALNVVKDAHGILLMYDITDKTTFDSIPNWIQNIKDLKGDDFPLILLGNKNDLEEERKISKEEGQKFADEIGIQFFETSNKTGINIQESGLALIKKIIEKKESEKSDLNSRNSLQISTKNKIKLSDDAKRCC